MPRGSGLCSHLSRGHLPPTPLCVYSLPLYIPFFREKAEFNLNKNQFPFLKINCFSLLTKYNSLSQLTLLYIIWSLPSTPIASHITFYFFNWPKLHSHGFSGVFFFFFLSLPTDLCIAIFSQETSSRLSEHVTVRSNLHLSFLYCMLPKSAKLFPEIPLLVRFWLSSTKGIYL